MELKLQSSTGRKIPATEPGIENKAEKNIHRWLKSHKMAP